MEVSSFVNKNKNKIPVNIIAKRKRKQRKEDDQSTTEALPVFTAVQETNSIPSVDIEENQESENLEHTSDSTSTNTQAPNQINILPSFSIPSPAADYSSPLADVSSPIPNDYQNEESQINGSKKEIEIENLKMSDLCKSKFRSVGSNAMKKLKSIKRTKLTKSPLQTHTEPNSLESSTITEPEMSSTGPQVRVVNGQIILDQSSLSVSQQPNQNVDHLEQIEESHHTVKITSASFMKKEKLIKWTNEDNELFYTGLKCFGTDFEMISKLFPNRSRRLIKLKFNKEERCNNYKVEEALRNRQSYKELGLKLY